MAYRLQKSLDAIFNPRSVAVIGASNHMYRWGYSTLRNMLLAGYRRNLYPINPNESEIQGVKCYPSLNDVPEPIDLAINVVNTSLIADVIDDCIQNGVKGGIVITAGFAEISSEGADLQKRMAEKGRDAGFHFVGPNCWGIWSSEGNVNTVFGSDMQFKKGPISFLSQSGTLGEYFYNGAAENGFGVSKFISCGNQACIGFNDFAPPPLNPIDSIARKHMSAYQEILEIVAKQETIDGIIMTQSLAQFERRLSSDKMIRGIELAERTAQIPEKFGIPLVCASVRELDGPMFEIFKRYNIPFYDNPMDCAKVMRGLIQYGNWKNA